MSRWHRLKRLAPAYLAATVRREWQLAILALVCLAPSVAALVAWLQVAWRVRDQAYAAGQLGWLIPPLLVNAVGPAGVLAGAGVATLLIGCLGLSNAYLFSVERRQGDLALLLGQGLSRTELASLLLAEALGLATLGVGAGLLLGLALHAASWLSAKAYFQLEAGFVVLAGPLLLAVVGGIMATLLFVGVTGIVTVLLTPLAALRGRHIRHGLQSWSIRRLSVFGTGFAGLLTAIIALPALGLEPALALTGLALGLALLLNVGGWLLSRSYWRLPTPSTAPLWALAIQGLARHPRQTVGMTLVMTAGSMGVGLSALPLAGGLAGAIFPLWVVAMLLAASGSLVLTTAALAALERRQELGLLAALGARPARIQQLILLEYAIVAIGGGLLGALIALVAWGLAGGGRWLAAVAIALADLLAALVTAWLGAAPVLWLISRRPPGEALRDE